ncbi:GNAT family N-acetyltransferase [Fuscibacter oryzae]|nr:GNAT family N-acetyltransferase [Fuscibacter oryzae]
MEATWPPARRWPLGPFALRDGAGGGKRVSAASATGPWLSADLDAAEAAMDAPLFLIGPQDQALDMELAAREYTVIDPVLAYAAPVADLVQMLPKRMTTFPHWPPMQIARDLWAEGGIGPARVAVMHRAKGAKTAILGRAQDRAAGVAFVACDGDLAMLHALEVSPAFRRQGSAHNILRAAALWAQDQGATTLSLVVTTANAPARALYTSVGMQVVGHYHYRQK